MAAACSVQEYHDAVIGRLKLEARRKQQNNIEVCHLVPHDDAESLHPQKHGDFNNFTFWRYAFRNPHSKGVGYSRMRAPAHSMLSVSRLKR